MNIRNEGILNPKPGYPNGYVSKDEMWSAVPWGKKFVIIHNGFQVETVNNYDAAKSYILKQLKVKKSKSTSSLENFLE